MTKNNRQRWGCIYKLTNQVNGKCYFGKTLDFKRRMKQHRLSAKKAKTYLARAIRKHGWQNFNVEILISEVPEEDLNMLEKSYIEIFDAMNSKRGYNLTRGGEGVSGFVPSEEQRKNMSKKMKIIMANRDKYGYFSYNRRIKAYRVFGPQRKNRKGGEYVGQYDTKEEAKNALEIFNKTGKKGTKKRKKGTGCICKQYNSRFMARYKNNYLGTFSSEKEAEEAISNHLSTF